MVERTSRRTLTSAVAALTLATTIVVGFPARAQEDAPVLAERRFTVMTYNAYLGANLRPLFDVQTINELIGIGDAIFRHLDLVDFNDRALAIAEQIGEQKPDLVALQEVALWQTAPYPAGTPLTTRYDFLRILMDELERQKLSYGVVSVNDNFHGEAPITLAPPTLGAFTDRNVILARTDLPTSELKTSNPREAVYDAAIVVPVLDDLVQVKRGWPSVDVTVRGKTYRFIDTHFEAFHPVRRAEQVGELVEIMSGSPYPVVLAGDINLYPQAAGRPEDVAPWDALEGAGFVDAWVQAKCFEPRFTAGQTDDLDNVPSALDNTVDYVLYDADFEIEAIPGSCDIAGEELDDRTATVPALWPSDHAAVVVDMHIAKP